MRREGTGQAKPIGEGADNDFCDQRCGGLGGASQLDEVESIGCLDHDRRGTSSPVATHDAKRCQLRPHLRSTRSR